MRVVALYRYKIRDILFGLMVSTCIFNYIPNFITLGNLAWPVTHQLFFYPFMAGVLFSLYSQWKWRDEFIWDKRFNIYIIVYVGILLLSFFVGIWKYPYFHDIIQDPHTHIKHVWLAKGISYILQHPILPETQLAIIYTMKGIVQILLQTFYTFGLGYFIYCWYCKNPKQGLFVFGRGILISLVIFSAVGIINVAYLLHFAWAKHMLEQITPYYIQVVDSGDWWPPLLWPKQLRSVLPEPSYIGNYAAFCLPVLWVSCLNKDVFKISTSVAFIFTFVFTYLVFMTQARTPIAIFIGMFVIFLCLLSWKKQWMYWKKIVSILAISGVAFGFSLMCIQYANIFVPIRGSVNENVAIEHETISTAVISYVDSNMKSLASKNDRSNGARIGLIKTGLQIAESHPVLGVGQGLLTAYIIKHWEMYPVDNYEIQMWLTFQQGDGLVSHEINTMNEYVDRLSSTGILGLLIFLVPFAFILYRMFIYLHTNARNVTTVSLLLTIWAVTTVIACLVAAMNQSYSIVYGGWFTLGIIYTIFMPPRESVNGTEGDF